MSSFVNDIQSGRFVTVTFVKKDGTIRTINGRTGVKKYLKGGKSTLDPEKFITIYSMADEGYRAIAKDRILEVKSNGSVIYTSDPYHLWDE